MEPLAENRFVITKELYYEGALRVDREHMGPFTKKAMLALAAAWAVLAAVTLFSRGSVVFVLIELGVIGLVGVWLSVFFPRSRARRGWRALESRCGTDLERVTRFYEDRLEIDGAGAEVTIPYEEAEQFLSSDHLLILLSTGKKGVLLARDGFVTGSADLVQDLIEQYRAAPDDADEDEEKERSV